jgi:hypothetical protein
MFGMTRKQFLKKSKKTLEEIGNNLLVLMQITEKVKNKNISIKKANIMLEAIRKDIESIFNNYQRIKPPSECFFIYRKLLNNLVLFQEAVNYYRDYLNTLPNRIDSEEKLKIAAEKLECFRSDFKDLSEEIRKHLK